MYVEWIDLNGQSGYIFVLAEKEQWAGNGFLVGKFAWALALW